MNVCEMVQPSARLKIVLAVADSMNMGGARTLGWLTSFGVHRHPKKCDAKKMQNTTHKK